MVPIEIGERDNLGPRSPHAACCSRLVLTKGFGAQCIAMSQNYDGTPGEEARAPASQPTGGSAEDTAPLRRPEIEAFAGRNGRVYWDLLRHAVGSRSLFVGFNLAGAALPFAWLLYRRMYWEFAVAALLAELLRNLMRIAATQDNLPMTVVPVIVMLASLVGSMGNGLYLRRIRKATLRIRVSEPDSSRRLSLLAKQGGTSMLAMLLFLFVSAAIIVGRWLHTGPSGIQ
jgi:hypothetical protein